MSMLGRVWILAPLAGIIVYILQLWPIPGIFLMMMGGPFVPGLCLHIALIAFALDAWSGRIPCALISLPLLCYGAYYSLYALDSIRLHALQSELTLANSAQVMTFDPTRQSLISDSAPRLVANYAIPVAYSREEKAEEGYRAHMLAPRALCNIQQDSQMRVRVSQFSFARNLHNDPCNVSLPAIPDGEKIEFSVESNRKSLSGFTYSDWRESIVMLVNGSERASIRTLHTWRLSPLPFLVAGCALSDNPSAWVCIFDFWRSPVTITSKSSKEMPEAVLLGLKHFTKAQESDFHGYPSNALLLVAARQEAERIDDQSFRIFTEALDNQNTRLVPSSPRSFQHLGSRLSPLASRIATRFKFLIEGGEEDWRKCALRVTPNATMEQLRDRLRWEERLDDAGIETYRQCKPIPGNRPSREELLRTLEAALVALPEDNFRPLAPHLAKYLHDSAQPPHAGNSQKAQAWHRFPYLYLRSADAMPAAWVEADYTADRFAGSDDYIVPVLGLCRVGHPSARIVAALKIDFANARENVAGDAAFLALLKAGEQEWASANVGYLAFPAWGRAVMDKKHWNSIGPNNCMLDKDLAGRDLPDSLKPLLKESTRGGSWAP